MGTKAFGLANDMFEGGSGNGNGLEGREGRWRWEVSGWDRMPGGSL